MELLAWGLSHHTAPVALRERFHLEGAALAAAQTALQARPEADECVLFSTCNRTEVYALTSAPAALAAVLPGLLADAAGAGAAGAAAPALADATFCRLNDEAARHLFLVAAGADSLVLGETQILGQLKAAYQAATAQGTVGTVLHRLFASAFRAGKRVHAETAFGAGAVSVGHAAVELAQKIFGKIERVRALLIGAGETGELVAQHFAALGGRRLVVTNRSYERAARLAARYGARAAPFEKLPELLAEATVAICSTSAPEPLLTVPLVRGALERRREPLFLIDIAVPRDVDPAVGALPDVFLHDIDSLERLADANLRRRQAQLGAVREIVEQELAHFLAWHRDLAVAPVVRQLRAYVETLRARELERHRAHFPPAQFARVEALTAALVNKILHRPQVQLKGFRDGRAHPSSCAFDDGPEGWAAARHEQHCKLALLRDLFALEELAPEEPMLSDAAPPDAVPTPDGAASRTRPD